jgi:hypothetical protein
MAKYLKTDDDLFHFVPITSDSPIGMCGNFVRVCGDNWSKVTCPECLKYKPMPKRIQRMRIKGWRMPKNTVYVGRPTKWGNSYIIESEEERAEAVESFEIEIKMKITRRGLDLSPLRGKDLACWCPLDKPCHADVLLKLANAEVRDAI